MESRAAERQRRRAALQEKYEQAERQREEEEEARRQAAEDELAAKKLEEQARRRDARRELKRRELEAEKRRAMAEAKGRLASLHYARVLCRAGFKPWCRLVQWRGTQVVMAARHALVASKRSPFSAWRQLTAHCKRCRAAQFGIRICIRQQRRVRNVQEATLKAWRQRVDAAAMEWVEAGHHNVWRIIRGALRQWRGVVVDEIAHREHERFRRVDAVQAIARRMVLRWAILSWERGAEASRFQSASQRRQQELRSKVSGWLSELGGGVERDPTGGMGTFANFTSGALRLELDIDPNWSLDPP